MLAGGFLHDCDLCFEGIEFVLFIKFVHSHLFDGDELVKFEVFDFEDFAESSFAENLSVLPIVSLKIKLIVVHGKISLYRIEIMRK